MPDEYSTIYSDDPRTGALSYPQLEARRRIAVALAARNRPYPKTIGEGLTALGEGLGEGYMNRNIERAEAVQLGRDNAARTGVPPGSYVPGAAAPGRVSEVPADNVQASYTGAAPEASPAALAMAVDQPTVEQAQKPPGMSIDELKLRLARNESGGAKDPYSLIGPVSRRGDYPYGKYQVMGENIPKWTRAYLGKELTPQEFLLDKDAQEAVASGQAGKYMAKYGPDGAARAWFAGENGMNDMKRKDTLGTHVAEYSRRFNIPLVTRDQVVASAARSPATAAFGPDESGMAGPPVQLASLGGVPTPDTEEGGMVTPDTTRVSGPGPSREEIAALLMQTRGQAPPQQRVAQAAPIQPGIRPDATGGVFPPPASQQQAPIGPPPQSALPPSREPIPPSTPQEFADPGKDPPPRPGQLGPSPAMQYWAKQIDNPMLSDVARQHAQRMYSTEDGYRKELQARQAEEYKNEREKWETARLAKDKHDREAGVRIQEELIRRLTIQKEQELAANRPVEAAKLQVELDQAIRTLNKPDTVAAGSTQFERPYAAPGKPQQPYAVPEGLPKPKEDMTETQAKATTFIVRTKPDLDRVDAEMAAGKALTSAKDAAIDALGPMHTGNMLISDDYRRARDALGNWGAAFLTHVSGAAVSPSEALRNLPAFIPRPGDTDRDIAEKAERRRNMMDAIATGTGDVGMKKVHEMNGAYEYRKNGEKEPRPVQSLEEAKGLPPGTRIILPDGKPGRVPARKY